MNPVKFDTLAKSAYTKLSNGFTLEFTGETDWNTGERFFWYFKPGVINNRIHEKSELLEPINTEVKTQMARLIKARDAWLARKRGC